MAIETVLSVADLELGDVVAVKIDSDDRNAGLVGTIGGLAPVLAFDCNDPEFVGGAIGIKFDRGGWDWVPTRDVELVYPARG